MNWTHTPQHQQLCCGESEVHQAPPSRGWLTDNLTWPKLTSVVAKRAEQRLCSLRKTKTNITLHHQAHKSQKHQMQNPQTVQQLPVTSCQTADFSIKAEHHHCSLIYSHFATFKHFKMNKEPQGCMCACVFLLSLLFVVFFNYCITSIYLLAIPQRP